MVLPVIFGTADVLLKEIQINEILSTNEESQKYGLSLTLGDAEELIASRSSALKGLGRVEIGSELIKKIIYSFCDSPYIEKDSYLLTLHELQYVFYYLKNETGDCIGDDELIEIIKDLFNNYCGGSIEYLNDCLEDICEDIKRGNQLSGL